MIAAKTIAAKIRFPVFFIRPILPKAQSAWAILFIYTSQLQMKSTAGLPTRIAHYELLRCFRVGQNHSAAQNSTQPLPIHYAPT